MKGAISFLKGMLLPLVIGEGLFFMISWSENKVFDPFLWPIMLVIMLLLSATMAFIKERKDYENIP